MTLLNALKCLADKNWLQILRILLNSDLCVGALAHHLGISKPAVSQHLQVLRKAGLVKGEKRGYWTHYEVDPTALQRIAAELNALAATEHSHETVCWRISDRSAGNMPSKEAEMCQNCCQKPEELKDKPETCSAEQIAKCHGDGGEHPCTPGNCGPEKQ